MVGNRSRLAEMLVWLAACSACSASDEGSPATTDPGTTDTDPSASTTAADSGSSSSTSEGTTTEPPPDDDDAVTTVPLPECGNGTVEPPEECDDGNLDPGDDCEADCTRSVDTLLWERTHSGAANVQDTGFGVTTDPEGNVYVVGFEVAVLNDPDLWLRKFDPSGEELLTVVLDPSMGGDDRGYGVAVDAQGNIFVCGRVAAAAAESDVWFAKLGPDGVELWSVTVPGPNPGSDVANDIAVDAAGDVAVGGYLRVANGDNDIWLGKFSGADGSELWAETVPGPDGLDDRIEGVEFDDDGNVVVAGFISNEGFNADVWVRKYDPDGAELWTTIYDSVLSGDEQAFDVAVAPDGSIGVAATTPTASNNDDVWLGKFEPEAGELIQQKKFGGPAILDDHGLGLAADSQSSYIVVGFKGIDTGDTDIWLRKWDAGGNVVWTQNVAGAGLDADRAWAVAVDADDNVVVTGERRPEPNNDSEIWIAKFAPE